MTKEIDMEIAKTPLVRGIYSTNHICFVIEEKIYTNSVK